MPSEAVSIEMLTAFESGYAEAQIDYGAALGNLEAQLAAAELTIQRLHDAALEMQDQIARCNHASAILADSGANSAVTMASPAQVQSTRQETG